MIFVANPVVSCFGKTQTPCMHVRFNLRYLEPSKSILCSVIYLLQTELKPSSETLSYPVVTYPCIVITLALLGLPSQGCIGLNISMYIAPPHPQ